MESLSNEESLINYNFFAKLKELYKEIFTKLENKINTLVLGDGSNYFGHETELDSSAYQLLNILNHFKLNTYYLNNNPYSFTLDSSKIKRILGDPYNSEIIKNVIIQNNIKILILSVSGPNSISAVNQLINDGFLRKNQVIVLGMPFDTLGMIGDQLKLNQHLKALNESIIESEKANNISDTFDIARKIGFPVLIKKNEHLSEQHVFNNADDLDHYLQKIFDQDKTESITVERSLVGLKEIGFQVLRDINGNKILIGALEDINPVGINTFDSISVTPVQTLDDDQYQYLRTVAFRLADELNIIGPVHIQFALDEDSNQHYVMKITPFFDYASALLARATGYPITLVATSLLLGIPLSEVKLPSTFSKRTALIEPTLDHIVVKFPIFEFDEAKSVSNRVNHRLSVVQKSVGSTIAVGRSVEEAILKAMRSAHFHKHDFEFNLLTDIRDDELVKRLIQPDSNHLMVILEAIRRGYEVDEISELTHINKFFIYKLRNIYQLELNIANQYGNFDVLELAKKNGLSDGLIAQLWNMDTDDILENCISKNVLPKYKLIEPTAGEFNEIVPTFYSTYEDENESNITNNKERVLVITTGSFRLGDGAAGELIMSNVIQELHQQGYYVIVLNNNPNAISLIPELADKRYIEPQEISDVINLINQEQPTKIFVPGNRIKLIEKIKSSCPNVDLLLINKAKQDYDFVLNDILDEPIYFYDQFTNEYYLIDIFKNQNRKISSQFKEFDCNSLSKTLFKNLVTGFYVFIDNQLVSLPWTHLAYLNKLTNFNWIRFLTRALLKKNLPSDEEKLAQLDKINLNDIEIQEITTDLWKRWEIEHVKHSSRLHLAAKILLKNENNFLMLPVS